MRALWLGLAGAAVIAAKLAGAYTFGFVASGSMEPALPKGSLFAAFRGTASVGDVVVFPAAAGELVVHRVVAVRPDGQLVTRGDANAQDDVAAGLGPVDPGAVLLVPQVAGAPLHVAAGWLRPGAVVALQVVLLSVGVRGLLSRRDGRPSRVQAHHLVLGAAALLLLTAPLYHDAVEVGRQVGVRASIVPIVAHVTAPGVDTVLHLGAMEEAALAARGAVEVVYAPDLPGAASLAPYGATAAVLPAAALVAALALAVRVKEA